MARGIVQNPIPLETDLQLRSPRPIIIPKRFLTFHGKGIAPDVEVDLDENLKSQAVVTPGGR